MEEAATEGKRLHCNVLTERDELFFGGMRYNNNKDRRINLVPESEKHKDPRNQDPEEGFEK